MALWAELAVYIVWEGVCVFASVCQHCAMLCAYTASIVNWTV